MFSNKVSLKPNFLNVFWMFFCITSVTIGGGYVIVPVIQRAIEKRKWLAEKEFYDLLALGQSLPGPIALNTALLTGFKIAGVKGFIAAILGVLIPPFFVIILIASLINAFSNISYVKNFLAGASAVIPGLTASLAFNMIKKRTWTLQRIVLTIAATGALIFSGKWAVPVFFVSAILAFVFEATNKKEIQKGNNND